MGHRLIDRAAMLALLAAAAIFGTGCSRSTLNYQIAESIGTLGQYENNEPRRPLRFSLS